MKKTHLSDEEQVYLESSYASLSPEYPPLHRFQNEICDVMEANGLCSTDSILDIGCGRGYLLKTFEERAYTHLAGIDPCPGLVQSAVSSHVRSGAFFDTEISPKSFDIAISCHTLHHLEASNPIQELTWMKAIARKYIVIVEVNNTNIPTFLMGLINKKTEPHVAIYNKSYIEQLFNKAQIDIIYSHYMRPGYLSGDSFLHKIAARIGTPPYSIIIGASQNQEEK